jgi:hypothetical protein
MNVMILSIDWVFTAEGLVRGPQLEQPSRIIELVAVTQNELNRRLGCNDGNSGASLHRRVVLWSCECGHQDDMVLCKAVTWHWFWCLSRKCLWHVCWQDIVFWRFWADIWTMSVTMSVKCRLHLLVVIYWQVRDVSHWQLSHGLCRHVCQQTIMAKFGVISRFRLAVDRSHGCLHVLEKL